MQPRNKFQYSIRGRMSIADGWYTLRSGLYSLCDVPKYLDVYTSTHRYVELIIYETTEYGRVLQEYSLPIRKLKQ